MSASLTLASIFISSRSLDMTKRVFPSAVMDSPGSTLLERTMPSIGALMTEPSTFVFAMSSATLACS